MAARNIAVDGLQLRNDTAANWRSKNPILLAGEAGIETDTKKIKVGDGETTWNSLAYANAVDLSGYLTVEDAEAGFTPISHSTKSGYSIGEIGAASTYGHVKLSDAYTSTLSTSSGCAATPKAVNSVYKIANAKQSPATSLAGYGITDAYTKEQVDEKIADAVTGGSVDLSGYLTRDEASTTYYTQAQVNEMMANVITEISVSDNTLTWTKGDGTTGSFDFSNIMWGGSDSPPNNGVSYTEVAYTEVGTHTFTVPEGVSKVKVAVIGGGGGYAKTNDILLAGDSSFGNIVATGGGNTWDNGAKIPVVAEPNGKTVEPTIDAITAGEPAYLDGANGFALDFSLDDGEYGAGGKVGLIYPFTMSKDQLISNGIMLYGGFSGGKHIGIIPVTAGETYTVVVGGGGGIDVEPQYQSTDNSVSNVGGTKGNDGAVLVAYGGDI